MSEKKANPAPLGLLGFGLTTILVSFFNARLITIDAMILGMGIFYGGIAQIIAGMLEYRRGNTFLTTAFTSYGFFWLTFVALNWLGTSNVWPFFYGTTPWGVGNESLMAYFFMWGLFTFMMFFATLKTNRTSQFLFMSLAILFFLLTARSALLAYTSISADLINWFTRVIGVEGIICGLSAFYLSMAEVLNETYERTVLPIGPVS
jgi:hypothetical protein